MESTQPTVTPTLHPILDGSLLEGAELAWIPGSEVPPPQSDLLVHDRDMTTALGDFHGDRITLTVLRARHDGDLYHREVTLNTAADGRPVEYGLIVIHLDAFPVELRARIVEGQTPLGTILNESGLPYLSQPQGFYAVPAAVLDRVFRPSSGGEVLYGRYNQLVRGDGPCLARILEILPAGSAGAPPASQTHHTD
jgi:hypothetical protein